MKFTTQDLAKAMGLKVGDRIKTDGFIYDIIEDGGCIMFGIGCNKRHLIRLVGFSYEILPPKPLLTEDEKVILRNLPKEYKWIARDSTNDVICTFVTVPKRKFKVWEDNNNFLTLPYTHLFPFIKWEDEPYEIAELLK